MGEHDYLNAFIYESSTIAEKAGDNLVSAAYKAVMYDSAGVIAKGDAVSVNDKGQAVKAETGSFVFGFAFSSAKTEGELIQIQINKAGKIA